MKTRKWLFPFIALTLLSSCTGSNLSNVDDVSLPKEYVEYSLNLDLNGGQNKLISSITRKKNTITALPSPTKDKAQFLGWFTQVDNIYTEITLPYAIPYDSFTLYAHYTNYKVTFLNKDLSTLQETYVVRGKTVEPYSGNIGNIDRWVYYKEDTSDPLYYREFKFNTAIFTDIKLIPVFSNNLTPVK